MAYIDLPKTRDEAIRLGSVSYFTGVPCRNGHIDKRYTNTAYCYSCVRKNKKKYEISYPEKTKEQRLRSKENRKSKYTAEQLRMYGRLRKKSKFADNLRSRKYRIKHGEKYLESMRRRAREQYKIPIIRLNNCISSQIYQCLKGKKNGRHWETLVNFTLEELKKHLESKFTDGMTWNNYGYYWHLDHVKPKSLCCSFQEIWSLPNLQPLKEFDNLSKGNRYIG